MLEVHSLADHGVAGVRTGSGNVWGRCLACLGTKNKPRQQNDCPDRLWLSSLVSRLLAKYLCLQAAKD